MHTYIWPQFYIFVVSLLIENHSNSWNCVDTGTSVHVMPCAKKEKEAPLNHHLNCLSFTLWRIWP